MAITAIDIVKDNIEGDCNVLSVFNPLLFWAAASYTDIAPDNLYFDIKDFENKVFVSGRMIPYSDNGGARLFILDVSVFLKKYFIEITDQYQPVNSLIHIPITQKNFTLIVKNTIESPTIYKIVEFIGLLSTRQLGQSEANVEIFNNVTEKIIAPIGIPINVYFWNDNINNELAINLDINENIALDFDNEELHDFDNEPFIIIIP
ncbi:MAG: hypothetical protein ACRC0V_07520 [Fusobacteriaceae bacterium]